MQLSLLNQPAQPAQIAPKSFTPSRYQQACLDFATVGRGNACVDAVAGSGKSTTLLQMCAQARPSSRNRIAMVCFNTSVRDHLKTRVPSGVDALTLHQVGLRAWGNGATVAKDKMKMIINQLKGDDKIPRWLNLGKTCRLVGLAKNEGLVPEEISGMSGLLPDTDDSWLNLIDHHGMDLGSESDTSEYLNAARQALTMSCLYAGQYVDFDDMIYMPTLAEGIAYPRYPWVFVDELQDVSSLQRIMVQGLSSGGRFVGVGDPYQAIYGWRGADVRSMDLIRQHLNCITLPLSICYRCPKSVIALAQAGNGTLPGVPHIETAPWAAEGTVERLERVAPNRFQPGDLVLCRNKAPLVTFAYALLRQRVKVRVLGREVGQGLITYVETVATRSRVSADSLPIEDFVSLLRQATMKAVRLASAKDDEDAVEAAIDREQTIMAVVEGVEAETAGDVVREINAMFGDADPTRVLLSTIHKAKGLEADNVWFLDEHLIPSRGSRQDWQRQQEANLWYVAVTRAKFSLRFIKSGCL